MVLSYGVLNRSFSEWLYVMLRSTWTFISVNKVVTFSGGG